MWKWFQKNAHPQESPIPFVGGVWIFSGIAQYGFLEEHYACVKPVAL